MNLTCNGSKFCETFFFQGAQEPRIGRSFGRFVGEVVRIFNSGLRFAPDRAIAHRAAKCLRGDRTNPGPGPSCRIYQGKFEPRWTEVIAYPSVELGSVITANLYDKFLRCGDTESRPQTEGQESIDWSVPVMVTDFGIRPNSRRCLHKLKRSFLLGRDWNAHMFHFAPSSYSYQLFPCGKPSSIGSERGDEFLICLRRAKHETVSIRLRRLEYLRDSGDQARIDSIPEYRYRQ